MTHTDKNAHFEQTEITAVPLEELRAVIDALAKNMGVILQRREVFFGEPEYRFVHK